MTSVLKAIILANRDFGAETIRALLERKDLVELVGVVPGDEVVRSFASSRKLNIIAPVDVNSDQFISQVKELKADFLLNLFFLQKYRSKILNTPRFGVINVHPSKLPFYRGRDCVRWAMICGEKEIGVTAHQMDEGLDTGQILAQATFPLHEDDNFMDVKEKLLIYYPRLVVETIEKLSQDKLTRKEQDPKIGTYFPHRRPEDSRIRWRDSAIEIHNLIRASYELGFYAYSYLGERKLFLAKSKLRMSQYASLGSSQRCGRVLDYDRGDDSSMLLGTRDGVISIEKCGYFENEFERARDVLKRGDLLT